MSKIVVLAAAAGGYVLGAKAGRERYEQIRINALRLWRNPQVQKTTTQSADLVKDKVSEAKAHMSDATREVFDKVKSDGQAKPDATASSYGTPSHNAPSDTADRVDDPGTNR